MHIFFLVIKILLWILLTILLLSLGLLITIVVLPIKYQVIYEKYQHVYSKVVVKYAFLKVAYELEDGKSHAGVTLFGKPFGQKAKQKGKRKEETPKEKATKPSAQQEVIKEPLKEQSPTQRADKTSFSNETTPNQATDTASHAKEETKRSEKSSDKSTKPKSNNKAKSKEPKKPKKKPAKSKINWFDAVKKLWQSEDREAFVRAVIRLIKGIFRGIRPKTFRFELLFGLENPADTGEWIGRAAVLYPLYAPYGQIIGNFEEQCLEGGVWAEGKFSLWMILWQLILLALNGSVRRYIRLILNLTLNDRKGEEHGTKIK